MSLVSHRTTKNKVTIYLKGDIGIDYIVDLQTHLMDIVTGKQVYEINFQEVEQLDLASLQVLAAFRNKIREKNDNVKTRFVLGSEWSELIQTSGFTHILLESVVDNKNLT